MHLVVVLRPPCELGKVLVLHLTTRKLGKQHCPPSHDTVVNRTTERKVSIEFALDGSHSLAWFNRECRPTYLRLEHRK